jgi:hypothetical protein
MLKTLDENPTVGFTYGDYIIVKEWGKQTGRLITEPEYEQKPFIQGMHLGPFYMWRKSLCDKIGYWDEQFKSGSDFDYASRLAVESSGKKTLGQLGYYLDEGLGLSTGKTPWQVIERTAIELRFGMYHKLDFLYYNRAKKYRINDTLLGEQWIPIKSVMPHYKNFVESKAQILLALILYPLNIIKRIINKLLRLWT